MHEVIDQGGEPIKVQEYFGVGRVTEFRYGIKVRARICKPFKGPRNRFPAWRNRFLRSWNVYKYGLSVFCFAEFARFVNLESKQKYVVFSTEGFTKFSVSNRKFLFNFKIKTWISRCCRKREHFEGLYSVLLHNGGSCNACTVKWSITFLCIPKQIMWQNGVVL